MSQRNPILRPSLVRRLLSAVVVAATAASMAACLSIAGIAEFKEGEACARAGEVCDPVKQCGCPSADENCVLTNDGKSACVASGTRALLAVCTGDVDCAKGSECRGGLCLPFCASVSDCAEVPNAFCAPATVVQNEKTVASVTKVCRASCDPLDPTTCPSGLRCGMSPDGNGGYFASCTRSGSGRGTNTCKVDIYACAPQHECDVLNNCRKTCRVGGDGCELGQKCLSWGIVIAGIEYGRCAPNCDPLSPAEGCGANASCIVFSGSSNATECYASGGGGEYTRCDKDFKVCAPRLTCDGETCRNVCRVGGTDCAAGTTCDAHEKPRVVNGVEYGSCVRHGCRPHDPTTCGGSGLNCVFDGSGGAQCIPAGSSTTKCSNRLDCAPGYNCNTRGECLKFCRTSGGSDCLSGQRCAPYDDRPSADRVEYGACISAT